MDEPIGNMAAGALLGFLLEEVGPLVYNQAVTDVQDRLQARVMEVDVEVHEPEFAHCHTRFTARRQSVNAAHCRVHKKASPA